MAEQTSAQTRLDKLVTVIAANMVAEVCSIYLRRAGKALELFATEGLNPAAVHRTRMKEGEGLVGLVAETAEAVNLSDAPSHPHFSYRPETGEDPYHSFLGVPIVRGGQVFGVLTVQNRAARQYAEEEVEALQTVAMVLAEVVAQGGLFNVAELDEPELRADRPRKFRGEGLSEGVAVGRVVLHEPRVKVERMIADNPQDELVRLEEAIGGLRHPVDQMLDSSELDLTGESREVIEAYRLFAHDQGWRQRMRDAVRTGLTAEAAVERVQDEMRLRVSRLDDPILRERAHDLDDLARRLLRHLTGRRPGAVQELPRDAVLVARGMGPAELLDYRRDQLARRWCWRKPHRPPMSPSWRAPWACRWSVRPKASPTPRARAIRSWSTARPARRICARARRSLPPSRPSARLRAHRVGAIRRHPRSARRDQGRRAHQADDECRPAARHAASAANPAPTASACSAPSCNS